MTLCDALSVLFLHLRAQRREKWEKRQYASCVTEARSGARWHSPRPRGKRRIGSLPGAVFGSRVALPPNLVATGRIWSQAGG
jgi:hypothetical protein